MGHGPLTLVRLSIDFTHEVGIERSRFIRMTKQKAVCSARRPNSKKADAKTLWCFRVGFFLCHFAKR